MKRLLIVFIFLGVFVQGPHKVLAEGRQSKTKIGVVIPLTGGASSNGDAIRNSVILADEEFDTEDRVKFVFEDDQLKPSLTVSAVNKLINFDQVAGLIVFGSPTSLAINSIAERRRVPMIGLSIVDRVVRDKKYVVKHWVPLLNESNMVNAEVQRRGYKRVALVTTINDAMLALRDHFVQGKTAAVVLDEEFSPDDVDFRTVAARIRSVRPDAVYNLLWAPQPGVFSKTLREAGYQGEIFGAHNLEDPSEIEAARGTLDGVWYVTGDDRAAGKYYSTYRRRFGRLPANGGINGYDSAKLFIEALKSGDVNTYLHTVKSFEGAYGTYGATGKNDFDIRATVKVIDASSSFKAGR